MERRKQSSFFLLIAIWSIRFQAAKATVCVDATITCNMNAACDNSTGTPTCICKDGYTGDGSTCTGLLDGSGDGSGDMLDECALNTHNCHSRAICNDTDESFFCTCMTGYSGNGVNCINIDECSSTTTHNCHSNATCTDNDGSFDCMCNAGYTGDGTNCTDINECSSAMTHNCHSNATCTDNDGSFDCMCNAGYTGDGIICTDIDECSSAMTHNCHSNATCTDNDGSFDCMCNAGYSGDGIICANINECSSAMTHNCHSDATCTDNDGSFDCMCNAGYTGDGTNCTDIDECKLNLHNCHPNATCSNLVGSFDCTCIAGYSGNGTSCTDIDECKEETHNCTNNARCTNLPGTFSCSCLLGFGGNGTISCQEIESLALETIAIKATFVNLKVLSRRTHAQIEINVTSESGNIILRFDNAASVTVENLMPDTLYKISATILVLNNGAEVEEDSKVEGQSISFNTDSKRTPANAVSQDPFQTAFNDLTSPESQEFLSEIRIVLFLAIKNLRFIIFLLISPGSSVATLELVSNTTNETLEFVPPPDSNLSIALIPEGEVEAPGNVTISNVTTSSLVVTYNPVDNAIIYQISVDANNMSETFNNNGTMMVITDLTPNTDYSISVRALVNLANSSATRVGNSSVAQIVTTVSLGPQNLNVVVLTGNSVQVHFDAIDNTDTYHISFPDHPEHNSMVSGDEVVNNSLSKRVDGLVAETTYNIEVIANVDGQNSVPSTVNFTTGPESVSGVRIFDVDNQGFQVEFDPVLISPSIDIMYTVRYSSVSGMREEDVSSTNAMIMANPIEFEYNVSVAYVTTILSPFSASVSTNIFDIVEVTSTSVTLTFDSYKSATHYNVSVFSTDVMTMEVNETTKTIMGLTPGTEYFIAVSTGEKPLFNVSQLTCPPQVMNFTCVPVSFDCIAFSWNAAKSASMYTLYYGDGATNATIHKNGLSAQACNLTTGVMYNATIVAGNGVCPSMEAEIVGCVTDVDECVDNTHDCNGSATCENTVGSFTCSCNTGFTGNGTSCTDIDECATNTDNCADDVANCMNSMGSFSCACIDGYSGNGLMCIDIDECAESIDDCHDNSTCKNNNGSFTCSCNEGFSGNGTDCTNIDECATNTDNCADDVANCTDSMGSFTCVCIDGYSGNGVMCIDIDECAESIDDCHDNSTCKNNNGSFTCSCNEGFSGNGTDCTNIDECATNTDNCADDVANCTDIEGSFSCVCIDGYNGNGVNCTDNDECTEGTDDCDASLGNCTNIPGSFNCTCITGYSGDGKNCTDIDECSTARPCDVSSRATCNNTEGSYTCECNTGYSGNGVVCEDINECEGDLRAICHLNANCNNNNGSFTCTCQEGYAGDGVSSCLEIETLPALVLISIKRDQVIFQINPSLPHIQYEVSIYSNGTVFATRNFTSLVGSFEGLSAETEYSIAAHVTILNNNASVRGNESSSTLFTTRRPIIRVRATLSDVVFTDDLLDQTSVAFMNVSRRLEEAVELANLSELILDIIIRGIVPGSAIIVADMETNSSSVLTINDAGPVSNFSLTGIEVSMEPGPSDLTHSDLTQTSFTLTWTDNSVSKAIRFIVEVDYQNTSLVFYVNGTTTTANITGLLPNTPVAVNVQALVNSTAPTVTDQSPTLIVTTLAQGPTNLLLTPLHGTSIDVTFDNVANANRYFVALTGDSSQDKILLATEVVDGKFTTRFDNLISETMYNVMVVPEVNGANGSASSASVTTGPMIVNEVVVYNVSLLAFSVLWTNPVTITNSDGSNEDVMYVVKYENSTGPAVMIETNLTRVTIHGTPVETPYDVTVAYKTSAEESMFTTARKTDVYRSSSSSPNQIEVSWVDVPDSVSTFYTVQIEPTSFSVPSDGVPNRTISSLDAGTNYNIKVNLLISAGTPPIGDTIYFTVDQYTLANPPQNVMFTSLNETCFSLTWNPVQSATSYVLNLMKNQTMVNAFITFNNTQPSAEVCNIASGDLYNVSVVAINPAGESAESDLIEAHSELIAPTNVSITPNGMCTCFSISWNMIPTAVSYTASLVSSEAPTVMRTSMNNNVEICGLEAGTIYNASVYATYQAGNSANSTDIVYQITAPPATNSVTVTAVETDSVTLSWNTAKSAIEYFVVVTQVEPVPGFERTDQSPYTNATVGSLTAGYVYNFTVIAQNSCGNSSESAVIEQITTPDMVIGFMVNNLAVRQTFVPLNWNNVTGASSYNITVSRNGVELSEDSIRATSWDGITVFEDGLFYGISIVAVTDERGIRQISAPANLTFLTAPPTPVNVMIGNILMDGMTVSWNMSRSADQYEVILVQHSNTSNSFSMMVAGLEFSFSSLLPGTVYNATVRANNSGGWSLPSTDFQQITVPEPTSNLIVSMPVEQTLFELSWTAVDGVMDYRINVTGGSETINSKLSSVTNVTFDFSDGVRAGYEYTSTVEVVSLVIGIQQISSAVNYTFMTAPDNTSDPMENTTTETTISAYWTAARGAIYYIIDVIHPNMTTILSLNQSETSVSLSELEGGTQYTIQVTAHNRFGQSSIKSAQITTNPACPAFNISDVAVDSFKLNWGLSNGASTGYTIDIDDTDNPSTAVGSTQTPPILLSTASEATISNLEAGTNYTVTMTAIGEKSSQPPCSEIQITLPGPVTNLMCDPANDTCFLLTWIAPKSAMDYATTYTDGTTVYTDAHVDVSIPSAEVCSVTTGSLYNASVSAINTAGTGQAVDQINCHSALPIPTDVTIIVSSPTCFNITWTGFPTATSYTVELTSTEAPTEDSTAMVEEDQICGLMSGVVYTANVKASYEAGDSIFSLDNDTQITAPPTPTNITLLEITTQSITLLWNPSKSAMRYYVETLQTAPTMGVPDVRMFSSNMATIDGLLPGYCYDFVLSAENDGGNSTSSASFEQITTPEAVQGFMVDTANVMQLTVPLVWNASIGATSYNLTVTRDTAVIASTSTSGTNWNNITGIMDGASYNVSIVAITDPKRTVQVSAPSTLTFVTAPSTPENVIASSITTNSMLISWELSTAADYYEIQLTQRDNTSVEFVMMTNSSTAEALFSSLIAGKVYIYRVLAINAGGSSLPSVDQEQITVPEAVTRLSVFRLVPQTSFRLDWDTKEGVLNYIITVMSMNGTVESKTTMNGFVTFEYVDGVRPGTEYVASVIGMTDMIGIPQNSSATTVTFSTAPQNTSVPILVSRNDTTITVQWSAATGALYYIVEAIRLNAVIRSNNVTSLSTTLTELQGGTEYIIQVVAYNDFGMSSNITDTIKTIPSCPDFSFSNINATSFTVTWLSVTSAGGYSILLQRTSDNTIVNPPRDPRFLGDTTLSTVVYDLMPGTNYTVFMTAHDTVEGLDSATCRLIQITVPAAPVLILSGRTPTTIGVSWPSVVGATEYNVIYLLNGMVVKNATVQVNSYTGDLLDPATYYYVRVRSINSAGFSESSFNHTTVIASGPDVTISNILTDGFTITTSEVEGRSTFDYSIIPGSVITSNSTSAMITDLLAGTEYNVTVFANYEFVGRTSGSTLITITTVSAAPGDLALVSSTQDEGITLSWSPVTGGVKYEITTTGTGGDMFTLNFTSSPATLSEVVLGTTYNFTIRAVNNLDAFSDFGQPLNLVAAAAVKTVSLQLTLNSTYVYSASLQDNSSAEFIRIRDIVLVSLQSILENTNILKIIVVRFFQGSVVVWVDFETNSTAVGTTEIINAFISSTENKDTFENNTFTDRNDCLESVCHANATCNNTETSFTCTCDSGFAGNGTSCTDIDECNPSHCDMNADCENTEGSFSCSCRTGYTGDGLSCSDVDECSVSNPCTGGSTCDNTNGSYVCTCPTGSTYNGSLCLDIDECMTLSPCHANAQCMNLEPSYICVCDTGYTGDGETCSDIDECLSDPAPCDANAQCTNNNGSFTCACNTGYVGDGLTCGNVDECLTDPCPGISICSDTIGSFDCNCPEGYAGIPTNCVDIDECTTPSLSNCHSSASCENTPGGFECLCLDGYSGNGTYCVDINECNFGVCTENETCTNTEGNFTCDCKPGFSGSPCFDIDECSTISPCHELAGCENVPGSFACTCTTGNTGNGTFCEDIDECADSDACADNSKCDNLPGSYQCSCNVGYSGNGFTECVDINECLMGVCDTNANCDNTDGSFICTCHTGFTGDGSDCEDIDECDGDHNCPPDVSNCVNNPGSFQCDCINGYVEEDENCVDVDECLDQSICNVKPNSSCSNTVGSFMCNCNVGFEPLGDFCRDINECQSDPCHTKADCANTEGSFTCTCISGYTGNGTSCTSTLNRVTMTQIINKYTFTEQLQRTTGISFSNLSAQVERQVNAQFSGVFTFVSVEFENGTNSQIVVRYIMETSISIPINFVDLYYDPQAGDTTLFNTTPNSESTCPGGLNCVLAFCIETNSVGSCVCLPGFVETQQSSTICQDDDECSRTGSCHSNASCTNNPGSFECTCLDGFNGDGTACSDNDECSTNPCQANAICQNTLGSFTCTCETGFEEQTNGNCTAVCSAGYCRNGATCIPSGTTPTCICASGYQGTRCEEAESTVFRDLAIAFGVIGGLLLIILIVALVVYCIRRKQGKMEFDNP